MQLEHYFVDGTKIEANANRLFGGRLSSSRKPSPRKKCRPRRRYALAVRRMIEPEPVFGDMKNNRGFKRFLLRGLAKVSLEVGRLSLAHNLLKKVAVDAKNQGAKREQAA